MMNLSKLKNQSFIDIDQVTKNYRDPASNIYFQALRGIDLKIKQGTISTIIGPSGAGKSSLLNIIGGMIRSSTGNVSVNGTVLNSLSDRDLVLYRRQVVGFLWQFPDKNLLPRISIYDNIIYTMAMAGYPLNKRKDRANQLLSSLGLGNRKKHRLGHLSGEEAQRASLAVSLANEPLLLLADEPTGELDSETTFEIIDYLKEINKDENITMLVVTHDTRFEKLSGKAYRILDGTIAGLKLNLGTENAQDQKIQLSTVDRIAEIENIKQEELIETFNINTLSPILLTSRLLPLLKKSSNPKVVNISSILGSKGIPYTATYTASKHALNGYSKVLRKELVKDNLKVVIIEPGAIESEFILRTYDEVPRNSFNKRKMEKLKPETIAAWILKVIESDNNTCPELIRILPQHQII